jgi:hypothetical protein
LGASGSLFLLGCNSDRARGRDARRENCRPDRFCQQLVFRRARGERIGRVVRSLNEEK